MTEKISPAYSLAVQRLSSDPGAQARRFAGGAFLFNHKRLDRFFDQLANEMAGYSWAYSPMVKRWGVPLSIFFISRGWFEDDAAWSTWRPGEPEFFFSVSKQSLEKILAFFQRLGILTVISSKQGNCRLRFSPDFVSTIIEKRSTLKDQVEIDRELIKKFIDKACATFPALKTNSCSQEHQHEV